MAEHYQDSVLTTLSNSDGDTNITNAEAAKKYFILRDLEICKVNGIAFTYDEWLRLEFRQAKEKLALVDKINALRGDLAECETNKAKIYALTMKWTISVRKSETVLVEILKDMAEVRRLTKE